MVRHNFENPSYRIYIKVCYDNKEYFYIQKKRSFLGITYWRNLKTYIGDCSPVYVIFHSIEEAREDINQRELSDMRERQRKTRFGYIY